MAAVAIVVAAIDVAVVATIIAIVAIYIAVTAISSTIEVVNTFNAVAVVVITVLKCILSYLAFVVTVCLIYAYIDLTTSMALHVHHNCDCVQDNMSGGELCVLLAYVAHTSKSKRSPFMWEPLLWL